MAKDLCEGHFQDKKAQSFFKKEELLCSFVREKAENCVMGSKTMCYNYNDVVTVLNKGILF